MSKSIEEFKPIYRLIPSSLKSRFESGELDVKCFFLVSDLAYEVIKRDGSPRSHLPRDRTASFLKGVLTKNYRRTLDLLIAEDILQVRSNEQGKESYSTTHHHCKQYSLTKKYRDELNHDGVSGMMIKDHRQLKRRKKFFDDSTLRLIKRNPWLGPEIEALRRLRYLKEDGDHFLRNTIHSRFYRDENLTNNKSEQLIKANNDLDNLLNSDYLPHVSISHNRVFNKLVNANREYREFIRTTSGERIVEVDMRSAQWVMLCKALILTCKYSYKTNLMESLSKHVEEPIDLLSYATNDIKAFVSAVLFQDIYSELGLLKKTDSYVIKSGYRHPDRDDFKEEGIEETLFNYFTKTKKDVTEAEWDDRHIRSVLRDTYPSVYNFLVQFTDESNKKKRSSDLAILMQKYEGFFFHQVLQKALESLLEGEGYTIIHDAFYLPESQEKEARKIMQETAEKWFGVKDLF